MLRILSDNLTHEKANAYGLVLTSSGLPYTVRRSENFWQLWVDEAIYNKAHYIITQYNWENERHAEPGDMAPGDDKTQTSGKTYSGLWVCLFLLACHVLVTMSDDRGKIVSQCGSSAAHILDGELYRTATSLLLHANYAHLAGNLAGIAIFGTAVCMVAGNGVGWLMILISGMIGNLVNAILFRLGHNSIGASTAVFGAIGIIAAYQFYTKLKTADRRVKAWLPLAGGLALLGFLGSGEHTDITAHLFGFVAGLCLGILYASRFNHIKGKINQNSWMAVTILIIVFSYLRAMNIL
jgi:membrane associated rhomboid family serine protease